MHKAMVLVLTQDNNAAKTAASGGQSSNGGKYLFSVISQISQAMHDNQYHFCTTVWS